MNSQSRHRRANSDLYGVKASKCIKTQSCKQVESTVNSHNLSSYEPKTIKSKKTNCPQTPTKKLDTQ